ncbi:hypothetical protein MPSEU_000020600 [Mayamaea pseudoterrestris]|nr:hypothetical protein MPSEU_000020600 [Mayamaea pseudoterrestris]
MAAAAAATATAAAAAAAAGTGKEFITANPLITTFHARYSDASNDPLQGEYAGLNSLTRTDAAADLPSLEAAECMKGLVDSDVENVPILVVPSWVEQEQPFGRIRAIVGAQRYRGVPGRPSSIWDSRVIGFCSECFTGAVFNVFELVAEDFMVTPAGGNDQYTDVTATLTQTLERLQKLPAGEEYLPPLLPATGDDATTIVKGRARIVQALPVRFAPLVIGQEFTRRAFFDCLAPAIVEAGLEDVLNNLCTWLKLLVTCSTADGVPTIPAIKRGFPRWGADLACFTHTNLRRLLPDVFARPDLYQRALISPLVRQAIDLAEARACEDARTNNAGIPAYIELGPACGNNNSVAMRSTTGSTITNNIGPNGSQGVEKKGNKAVFNLDYNIAFEAFQKDTRPLRHMRKNPYSYWPCRNTIPGLGRAPCMAYHLRGKCDSLCKRKADHTKHSPAVDDALLAWTLEHLEPRS